MFTTRKQWNICLCSQNYFGAPYAPFSSQFRKKNGLRLYYQLNVSFFVLSLPQVSGRFTLYISNALISPLICVYTSRQLTLTFSSCLSLKLSKHLSAWIREQQSKINYFQRICNKLKKKLFEISNKNSLWKRLNARISKHTRANVWPHTALWMLERRTSCVMASVGGWNRWPSPLRFFFSLGRSLIFWPHKRAATLVLVCPRHLWWNPNPKFRRRNTTKFMSSWFIET